MLAVTPNNFEQQLRILKQQTHVLSVQDLVVRLRSGDLPKNAVAITFDDGYADNLHNAKPLLEKYELPATVFVTTGQIGTNREFYWDELDRILLQPTTLPERLELDFEVANFRHELGSYAYYSLSNYNQYAQWTVASATDPTPRHEIYRILCERLRLLPNARQQAIMNQLENWAGLGLVGRDSHRLMSTDEVVELAHDGLIEVGAHTVTHTMLSTEDEQTQCREVTESKRYLESLLGHQVLSFSYPYGTKTSYTTDTLQCVKSAGLELSCANTQALAWHFSNKLELPRFLVRDWNGTRFVTALKHMFKT